MSTARRMARWLLVGRADGLRASLRKRLGMFTWLDRKAAPERPPAPRAPEAPVSTPADGSWTELVDLAELSAGEVIEVLAGERPIAVACTERDGTRRYHALDGVCPHAGGPLGDGVVEGDTLTCPWHGWTYDLHTGISSVDPSVTVETFEVRVRAGRLEARLGPA